MISGDVLFESRTLRESTIHLTDALDNVKPLTMFPDGLHISITMAEEYFDVGKEVMKRLIKENRQELECDGLRLLRGVDLIPFKDMGVLNRSSSTFTVITRRAVLRIGMLLREGEVARRIRNYLLNIDSINSQDAPNTIKKAESYSALDHEAIAEIRFAITLANAVGINPERAVLVALDRIERETGTQLVDYKKLLPVFVRGMSTDYDVDGDIPY